MTNLEKYLYQLRRIEEHRAAYAEKEIRKIYKELLKELNGYLGNIYATYSEDDMLSYGDLARAGMDARFLEEVEQRINGISPRIAKQIQETVNDTYAACYDGMRNAVVKAAVNNELLKQAFSTVKACSPEVIRAAVNNPVSGLTLKDTLEKHRKDIIYDIKQNIGVGLSNGDRYTTMAKRISESLDGDYHKSIRVVRTEAHRVRETGFNDAATEINNVLKVGKSGYVMAKTWRTMKDERVRPQKAKGKARQYNHVKMDGVTIPQDEEFVLPSGATCKAPSQTGVAGEDINCRCYLSYDLVQASELTGGKEENAPSKEEQEPVKTAGSMTAEEFKAQISQCKTTSEVSKAATEYFKNKEGCKLEYVDLGKMDLQAAKDNVLMLDDLTTRFNSGAKSIRCGYMDASISGMNTPTEKSFLKCIQDKTADHLESDIKLNEAYVRSKKAIDYDFKNHHRTNYGGVAYGTQVAEQYKNVATLVHEFGHSILAGKANEILVDEEGIRNPAFMSARRMYRQYLREVQRVNSEIMAIRDSYAGKPNGLADGLAAAKHLQDKLDDMEISRYAKESVGEFIAEAFCDALLSEKPKTISLKMLDLLTKEYGRGV